MMPMSKNINGNQCVSFNVAHSERRNNQETTTWVSVLMHGDGGNLTQYLKKGAKVFVRGNLSAKPYQDKNGQWCEALCCELEKHLKKEIV